MKKLNKALKGVMMAATPMVSALSTTGLAAGINDTGSQINTVFNNPAIRPFITKIAPIVGTIFWIFVMASAILFIAKTVMSAVNYYKAEEGDMKARKDAKDAMIKNFTGIIIVFGASAIVAGLLNILGIPVLNIFFNATGTF